MKGLEDVHMEDVKLEIILMCCLLKPWPSVAFHRKEHRSEGGRGLRPQMMFRETGQSVDGTGQQEQGQQLRTQGIENCGPQWEPRSTVSLRL